MNTTYTVYIENTVDNTERELNVDGMNPMDIHKDVFMRTSRYEEIRTICDSTGETVYDKSRGFYGRY